MEHLARVETILKQASSLPRIEPLPANPSPREILDGYVKLAYAYAQSTVLLQQTIPLIVEELRDVRAEVKAKKKAKRRAAKKSKNPHASSSNP